MKNKLENFRVFNLISALGLVFAIGASGAFAQTAEVAKTEPVKTEVVENDAQEAKQAAALLPALTEYKGIKIGMPADEVRDKLNKKPEVADKDGFYYVFSDEESARIILDADKKVRVISVIYSDKKGTAPKYEDVFGKEVPLVTMPDGRVYNLVRYPDAGFWVAYNRTVGDSPLVTVTMQKL